MRQTLMNDPTKSVSYSELYRAPTDDYNGVRKNSSKNSSEFGGVIGVRPS